MPFDVFLQSCPSNSLLQIMRQHFLCHQNTTSINKIWGEEGQIMYTHNFDVSRPTFHLFNVLLSHVTCSGPCVSIARNTSLANRHGTSKGLRSKWSAGPRSASFSDPFGLCFLPFLSFAYKFVWSSLLFVFSHSSGNIIITKIWFFGQICHYCNIFDKLWFDY